MLMMLDRIWGFGQKPVQLMLMMLGRIWGLRQKTLQLMLMMLGRLGGFGNRPAANAHAAGWDSGATERLVQPMLMMQGRI